MGLDKNLLFTDQYIEIQLTSIKENRKKQFTRGKGFDSFAPCGPWITTIDEIAGGGMAIGVLCGKKEIMEYADTTNKKKSERSYIGGGTFLRGMVRRLAEKKAKELGLVLVEIDLLQVSLLLFFFLMMLLTFSQILMYSKSFF